MIVKEPPALPTERPPVVLTRAAAYWSLFVLIAVNVLNFYDRHVAGAVVEPIRREFSLTDAQIGWINFAFTFLYGLVGLPLGRLADTTSRKKLLAAGVVVWAALTASVKWVSSYSLLLMARLGVGVGEATCAPTATSWIGDLFPAERRSKPLALFMLGVPVGGALSFFFSGTIALHFGWRMAMVLAAAPALLLVPMLLALKEPARGAAEQRAAAPAGSIHGKPGFRLPTPARHSPDSRPQSGSIWQVLRIPTFWWIVLSGALVNFNLYVIGTFLPAFFGRVHRMNVAQAGFKTGIVYAIGGVMGGLVAGVWGDHIVRRSPRGRMLIAAIAALLAAPLSYFGIHQPYGALSMALPLLTIAYGLLNMYYGLVYAAIQDIVAPALRGTSMAIYFLAMYWAGASWGTVVVGELSDRFARHAAALAGSSTVSETFKAIGLQQAMLTIPVLSVALGLVLWAGSRTIEKDMQKRNQATAA